jgi:hypothetical protein
MIRTIDIYRRTQIQNVYREELWLFCFEDSPNEEELESFFDNESAAYCRGHRQLGSLKLVSSSREFIVKG